MAMRSAKTNWYLRPFQAQCNTPSYRTESGTAVDSRDGESVHTNDTFDNWMKGSRFVRVTALLACHLAFALSYECTRVCTLTPFKLVSQFKHTWQHEGMFQRELAEFTVPSRSMVRTEICVHMPVFGITKRWTTACKTHDATVLLIAAFEILPHDEKIRRKWSLFERFSLRLAFKSSRLLSSTR